MQTHFNLPAAEKVVQVAPDKSDSEHNSHGCSSDILISLGSYVPTSPLTHASTEL